jgi:hypothetical protein
LKPKKIEKNTLRFSLISSAILLCAGIALVLVGRFASAKYKQNLRLNSAVLLGEYGRACLHRHQQADERYLEHCR